MNIFYARAAVVVPVAIGLVAFAASPVTDGSDPGRGTPAPSRCSDDLPDERPGRCTTRDPLPRSGDSSPRTQPRSSDLALWTESRHYLFVRLETSLGTTRGTLPAGARIAVERTIVSCGAAPAADDVFSFLEYSQDWPSSTRHTASREALLEALPMPDVSADSDKHRWLIAPGPCESTAPNSDGG